MKARLNPNQIKDPYNKRIGQTSHDTKGLPDFLVGSKGAALLYLESVMINVAKLIAVPTDPKASDTAGGTFHDERALLALGST